MEPFAWIGIHPKTSELVIHGPEVATLSQREAISKLLYSKHFFVLHDSHAIFPGDKIESVVFYGKPKHVDSYVVANVYNEVGSQSQLHDCKLFAYAKQYWSADGLQPEDFGALPFWFMHALTIRDYPMDAAPLKLANEELLDRVNEVLHPEGLHITVTAVKHVGIERLFVGNVSIKEIQTAAD